MKFGDPQADEVLAAFRKRVQEREAAIEERTELTFERTWSAREERFALDLTRLWRTAGWIALTGQFPDGQPLVKQRVICVEIWELFCAVLEARKAGAGAEALGDAGTPDGSSN